MAESNTSKKRYIKRGNDNIDLDRYIRNLEYNFDNWLDSKNLSDKEKGEVQNAYRKLVNGYNDQNLLAGLGNETIDSNNIFTDEERNSDAFKRALNYLHEILLYQNAEEDTELKSNKAKYDPSVGILGEINKELFNGKQDFDNNFLLMDDWDESTQSRGIANRLAAFNKALDRYEGRIGDTWDMSDDEKKRHQESIQQLRNVLSDGKIENREKLSLSNLGIDPDVFFYTGKLYLKEGESEPNSLDALIEQALREDLENNLRLQLATRNRKNKINTMLLDPTLVRDNYLRVGDIRNKFNLYNLDEEGISESLKSKRREYNERYLTSRKNRASRFADYAVSDSLFNGSSDLDSFLKDNVSTKVTHSDGTVEIIRSLNLDNLSTADLILARQKAAALDWIDEIESDESQKSERKITSSKSGKHNGWYIVNNGPTNDDILTVVNNRGQIHRIPVNEIISTGALSNYVEAYINDLVNKGLISYNKQGGVLKALFGQALEVEDVNSKIAQIAKETERFKKAENAAKYEEDFKRSGKETKKLFEESQRNLSEGLSSVDKARLTAIGLDLTSAGLSFTGAGSIPGGIVGLAGTAANLYADAKDDAVSSGEMLRNLGLGVGLSLFGAIPVAGGTGKATKAIVSAIRYIPRIAAAAGSAGIVFNDDIQKSSAKFLKYGVSGIKDGKYTNNDLRNLALMVGAVTGTVKMGNVAVKRSVAKRGMTEVPVNGSKDTYSIRTDKGSINLTESEYKAFEGAKTAEEANNILKGFKNADGSAKYADHNVIGKGSKWKLGFGKKDKFDSSSLKETKGETKFIYDPNKEQSEFLRFYLGDTNDNISDAALILALRNAINNAGFRYLFGWKNKLNLTPTLHTTQNPVAPTSTSTTNVRMIGQNSEIPGIVPGSVKPLEPINSSSKLLNSASGSEYNNFPVTGPRDRLAAVRAQAEAIKRGEYGAKDKFASYYTPRHTSTRPAPIRLKIGDQTVNAKVLDFRGMVNTNSRKASVISILKIREFIPEWTGNLKSSTKKIGKIQDALRKAGYISKDETINNYAIGKNGTIVFWKQGGKLEEVMRLAKGGILKGLQGITPQWYQDRYKALLGLGNWQYNYGHESRDANTSGIKGFRGDASNLNSVYSANNAYTNAKNYDNRNADLQSYFDSGTFTPEEYVKAYNTDAAKIRNFWSAPVYYKTANGINATNATEHNQLFKKMFNSRSQAVGEASGANLGYDTGLEHVAGSTTWHRRMDLSEKEYDLLTDEEKKGRTFTIKQGDKTFLVYKLANGDIGLLPTDINSPNGDPNNLENSGLNDPNTPADPNNPANLNSPNNTGGPNGSNGNSNGTPGSIYGMDTLDRGDLRISPLETRLRQLPINLSKDARTIATVAVNNAIHKINKDALKPYLKDTFLLFSPVTGDYGAMNHYYQQAAAIRNAARIPLTSDADKNFAILFEMNRKALELENQGFLLDNKRRFETGELLRKLNWGNTERLSNLANDNRRSLYENRRENAELDSARKLKNWNAIQTRLAEKEQLDARDFSDWRNFLLEVAEQNAKRKYNAKLDPYKQAYLKASQKPDFDPYTDPAAIAYQNMAEKLADDYSGSIYLTKSNLWPHLGFRGFNKYFKYTNV